MNFDETGDILTFSPCDRCFIYFLLRGGEVVYVGQTTNGLSRPFAHYDKEYDTVKVLPMKLEELDEAEDSFICKYKPMYNKTRNYNVICSLNRAKNLIKDNFESKFTMWVLRNVLRELNIEPFVDDYTGCECITMKQYNEMVEFIKRGCKNERISQT